MTVALEKLQERRPELVDVMTDILARQPAGPPGGAHRSRSGFGPDFGIRSKASHGLPGYSLTAAVQSTDSSEPSFRDHEVRPSALVRSMAETFRNFIGGTWVGAASGRTFETRNPADTDELIGSYPQCDEPDARQAIDAARAAQPAWAAIPAPKRGEILYRRREHPGVAG